MADKNKILFENIIKNILKKYNLYEDNIDIIRCDETLSYDRYIDLYNYKKIDNNIKSFNNNFESLGGKVYLKNDEIVKSLKMNDSYINYNSRYVYIIPNYLKDYDYINSIIKSKIKKLKSNKDILVIASPIRANSINFKKELLKIINIYKEYQFSYSKIIIINLNKVNILNIKEENTLTIFKDCIIDRNDESKFLINEGQNEVGKSMLEFSHNIKSINTVDDLKNLFEYFMKNIKHDKDNKIKKFERTSEEIFEDKIWSGCSDIGTALAPILRLKNIPTIYLQSAHIDWIKNYNDNPKKEDIIQGHIFLEIFIDNKWLLFDSTRGKIYFDYDFNNYSLPDGYYAFTKSLNGHELGYKSLSENNRRMKELFLGFDTSCYKDPNYKSINFK